MMSDILMDNLIYVSDILRCCGRYMSATIFGHASDMSDNSLCLGVM